jgi:N-acetylglucosamine kinase-like BadF-type ATPase
VQVAHDGRPGPVRTAPGVRIEPGGIDVAALVRAARDLLVEAAAEEPGAAKAAEEAGASVLDVVVWSMRGLLFLADRHEVLRTVRSGLGARRTVVVSDAVANLVGALGGVRPGAVVAAGTGAVAFGTDFTDLWRRVDGWGHVLGDVGSGAWLGLEGLRAALRAHDGLPEGSALLLEAGAAAFGDPATWPRQVMNAPDAPERLAAFAPAVCAAAAADPEAADACARAGRGLGDALLAASAGLPDPVLAATGGVLGAAPVRAALQDRLAQQGCHLTPAAGGALDGARLLGTHLLEVGALPAHAGYLLVD